VIGLGSILCEGRDAGTISCKRTANSKHECALASMLVREYFTVTSPLTDEQVKLEMAELAAYLLSLEVRYRILCEGMGYVHRVVQANGEHEGS